MKVIVTLILLCWTLGHSYAQDSLFYGKTWYVQEVELADSNSESQTRLCYIYYKSGDLWDRDTIISSLEFKKNGEFIIRECDRLNDLSETEKQMEKRSGIKVPRSRDIIDYDDGTWKCEKGQLIIKRSSEEEKYDIREDKTTIKLIRHNP